MVKKTDVAYLAGLIDGEGCLYIAKKKPDFKTGGKNFSYVLALTICSTYFPIIEYIANLWDGYIHYGKGRNDKRKDNWTIQWFGKNALKILKITLPYLIIKRQEALLAIRYQNGKIDARKFGTGNRPEHLARDEYYKVELQELKRL